MQEPFFSVIIPVYNVEKFLEECVESVLSQTFIDYEIILVDDGSPDNSPEICDKYDNEYEQIKVLHKKNGGLSDARNAGIKTANGKYIIFLDSDDKLADRSVLEKIYCTINEKGAPLFCTSIQRFSSETNITKKTEKNKNIPNGITNLDLFNLVCKENWLFFAQAIIVSRKFLIENDLFFKEGIVHEDMEWCPRVLLLSDRIFIYSDVFYQYRLNDTSITSRFSKKRFDSMETIVLFFLSRIEIYTEKNKEFLKKWLNMLLYMLFVNIWDLNRTDITLYNNCKERTINLFSLCKHYLNIRNYIVYFVSKNLSSQIIYFTRNVIKKIF